jgi:Flp pilus assembly protein TadG
MIRRSLNIAKDQTGAAAVEFALVAPILLVLAVGIAQFGLVLNNYVELTEATADGARQLALQRGQSTPYTTTVALVRSSAPNLTSANITITTSINGTACSSDSTCQTALNSAQGQAALVRATYPCSLSVMGVNYAPSCTLSSSTSEMIE